VCLITEKRKGRERPINVLSNLVETGMMKAIKLSPKVIFGDTNNIELIDPEIPLT
jgi:hypothetical protein